MSSYPLFCMGNPLLDIQLHTPGSDTASNILNKYNLKANDAILAEPEHASIYEEVVDSKHDPVYVAGGAAQNAARAAAYVLPKNSVVYTGCVGDDELAAKLNAANKEAGVESAYLVQKGEKTGACAVIITNNDRSLVTTLRAAEKFDVSHLSSPEVKPLVENAKFYYVGGFFLTHGVKSALEIAQHAATNGKTFALNLSAPFICQFFKAQLEEVLPYTDILFGNESEAEAWGIAAGLADPKDLKAVATALANLPKTNPAKPRIVVITSGAESTTVAITGSEEPKIYPVQPLAADQIVDTNGAGDAFAGGFMGAIVAGKTVDEAVEVAHKMGAMCVGQVGPQFRFPKEKLL